MVPLANATLASTPGTLALEVPTDGDEDDGK